jgi:spore coat polysaccharide biosynthesis protein SpsF (cytidylyltransferase family)/spore coat polysaccharide biosynthesis predicted glycosyltransferase SpsG/2-polyprenyl-3-methyl-5-hydroxy-6-metoxy-1,4-benzoquinol methylase
MLTKKVGLFLQVRLNSSRMPGKALLPLCGKPLIQRVMERMTFLPADLRVLVTTKDCEEYLEPIADSMGWELFCGDSQNVLKRFVECALFYQIDTVIRATGDNPLLSSEIARETLDLFNKTKADLAFMEKVPYGSGVEIIDRNALLTALKNTVVPYHLEHVTPYIYENRDKFRIVSDKFHADEVHRPDVRITVDTREDFERMNRLYSTLVKNKSNFGIDSVVKTYDALSFVKFRKILFLTVCGGMHGMGHLKRSLIFASKLSGEFEIYFSIKDVKEDVIDFVESKGFTYIFHENLGNVVANDGIFDRVIVDLRDTGIDDIGRFSGYGPVISIDDMGPGADRSVINVRTLPSVAGGRQYNFEGLEYLVLKDNMSGSTDVNDPPLRILVTFGGSDPDNLTEPVASTLDYLSYKVKAVIGPFFSVNITRIGNCELIHNPEELDGYIGEADLVITSFGMTLMEALIMKRPVILINPASYHDMLAEEFKYPYVIKRDKDMKPNLKDEVKKMVERMISEKCFGGFEDNPLKDFFSLGFGTKLDEMLYVIRNFQSSISLCPGCSGIRKEPVYRSANYNLFYCKKCNIYHLDNFTEYNDIYVDKYFTDEYKAQYGKTYEEDRANISRISEERIRIIKKYLPKGKLLDFGSGLGFFSETAEKNGFTTVSVDVSGYAVDYIRDKLHLDASVGDQSFFEKTSDKYDVISAFYVIEHIKDFEKLIFLFACHLNSGGVLVLSTPNADGFSIRYNFDEYKKVHPKDHYRIFSPGFLTKLLKKYGFYKIKVIITGIHPERIIKSEKLLKIKFIYNLLVFFQKILKLGDTFEIYAKKK